MAFKNTQVRIGEITEDTIEVVVGPETFVIPVEEFRQMVAGKEHGERYLLLNVAARLAISQVDLNNHAAVRASVQNSPFRY